MKIKKLFYLVIFCITLSSCGDWLTINPQDQIKEGELYSSPEGFHTQINGIYKVMSQADLYGRELSFGLVEALGQVYASDSYSSSSLYEYKNAAEYSYLLQERLKSMIDRIWEKSYNAITNCNSVIKYAIEADSAMFRLKDMERQCILGEAYALRAMLHFDILRLYAPSLVVNNSGSFVPYVKEFPTHIPSNTPSKEYIANVIEDLQKAHELTQWIDTTYMGYISSPGNRFEFTGDAAEGRFTSYRGYRLHHYAIKALLARVYLYAGNEAEALKYAQELIALYDKGWFKYDSSSAISSYGNMKLYGDVIFSLYNNFEHLSFTEVCPRIDESSNADYLSLSDFEGVFGEDAGRDYRAKQYVILNDNYAAIKYSEIKDGSKREYSNKMIPMLRISEMFYIAAECLYNEDKAKAESYLTTVRTKRGVRSILRETDKKSEFIQLIINDVRREQHGEGQLFFFYKRLNLPVWTINGESVEPGDKFYLPIPDSNNKL